MAASKTNKAKKRSGKQILRYAPPDINIPVRLGGGILKELVEQEMPSGKLLRYALAYINPKIFAGDNGRVLGYDNAHGHAHRHFMGQITPEPERTWEEIRDRFESEWRLIAMNFVNRG
jgi:hypothetical protein